MELEHKVVVLEVECASLHQELQEMEARNRRAQKKPSDEANQVLQDFTSREVVASSMGELANSNLP